MIAFLVVVGVLIFVHELGHFIAARAFGVRVLRFSIGFGPRLFGFVRGGTEFVVALLPLGGYVLMHGMHPDDEPDPAELGTSLLEKKPWQRAIVSLAGPLMNVLIAVPAFMAVRSADVERLPAVVGTVLDGTAADRAGLEPGDRVLRAQGRDVRYFEDLQDIVRESPGQSLELVVDRAGTDVSLTATPDAVAGPGRFLGIGSRPVGQLGVLAGRFRAVVDVAPGSVAFGAGLRTFDEVIRVGDADISAWLDLDRALRECAAPCALLVRRAVVAPASWALTGELTYHRIALDVSGGVDGAGLRSAAATVLGIEPGSPAAAAGLLPGDRVMAVDEAPVTSLAVALTRLSSAEAPRVAVRVERAGELLDLELAPRDVEVLGEFRTPEPVRLIGVIPWPSTSSWSPPEPVRLTGTERAANIVWGGIRDTYEAAGGIILGVAFMISGQLDSSNLGGPLLIADVVSRASAVGLLALLGTAALISVNLAVLNLLPVPGLDGGTLTLIAIEAARGRPPSPRTRQIIAFVGIVCIALLMLFAFKNDVERYWVDVANWLNS
jgi:regulator of sigma E protease